MTLNPSPLNSYLQTLCDAWLSLKIRTLQPLSCILSPSTSTSQSLKVSPGFTVLTYSKDATNLPSLHVWENLNLHGTYAIFLHENEKLKAIQLKSFAYLTVPLFFEREFLSCFFIWIYSFNRTYHRFDFLLRLVLSSLTSQSIASHLGIEAVRAQMSLHLI